MNKAEQRTITHSGLQEDMALISATYLKLTADAGSDFRNVDAAIDRVAAAIRTTSLAAQDGLVEALKDAGAHLAAAISLLEKGGKAAKKAAPSDKMFDQMIKDYKASLVRTQAALSAIKGDKS